MTWILNMVFVWSSEVYTVPISCVINCLPSPSFIFNVSFFLLFLFLLSSLICARLPQRPHCWNVFEFCPLWLSITGVYTSVWRKSLDAASLLLDHLTLMCYISCVQLRIALCIFYVVITPSVCRFSGVGLEEEFQCGIRAWSSKFMVERLGWY